MVNFGQPPKKRKCDTLRVSQLPSTNQGLAQLRGQRPRTLPTIERPGRESQPSAMAPQPRLSHGPRTLDKRRRLSQEMASQLPRFSKRPSVLPAGSTSPTWTRGTRANPPPSRWTAWCTEPAGGRDSGRCSARSSERSRVKPSTGCPLRRVGPAPCRLTQAPRPAAHPFQPTE